MFGLFVLRRRGFFPSETTDWSCDATRGTVFFTCIDAQIPIPYHKTYELKDIYLRLKKKKKTEKLVTLLKAQKRKMKTQEVTAF